MNPNLILCGDHKWAPWSVVCIHLASGEARDWRAVPQAEGSEAEFDWFCSKCKALLPDRVPIADMKAICIHCVKELQQLAALRASGA